MFDYDRSLPLDVKEIGVEDRNGVRIHDVSYQSPKRGRVTAYLVVPSWSAAKICGRAFYARASGKPEEFSG